MGLEFAAPQPAHRGLYAFDPRVKLGFVVVAVAWLFLLPGVVVALAVSAACLALSFWAGVAPVRTWRFLKGLAPLLALVLVLTSLFGGVGGRELVHVGPLAVTEGELARALQLASRLLALGLVFYLWLATTDQTDLVRGFVALGAPYDWGLTTALALRYLPMIAGIWQQVRDAQAARGLDLAAGGPVQRLRSYSPVLVATVISSLRNSERLGWALESRALGAPGASRTSYRPLVLTRTDRVALALLGLALAAGIWLRVR